MSSFHVRPRFEQTVDLSPDSVREKTVERISTCETRCTVKTFPGFVRLRIPQEERHFWSPRLTLSLYETEDGKTRICGMYGPNGNVWGLFLYAYLFVGFLGLVAAIVGISQWAVGKPPVFLWGLVVALAGVVALYLTAQFGQKLGANQTFRLHQAYERAMGKEAEIH